MTHLILLDNEAVQALGDPDHPKHRRVLSHIQVVAQRKRRTADISPEVPTAVRVEAGWDRTKPTWAFANQLRIRDDDLNRSRADTAAAIRTQVDVSVPDAHIGAVLRSRHSGRVTVLTSDPSDVRGVAGSRAVTIVTI
jgi:hypothetical protein